MEGTIKFLDWSEDMEAKSQEDYCGVCEITDNIINAKPA